MKSGLPGAGRRWWVDRTVVGGFVFGWWHVADGRVEAAVVVPADPFDDGVFGLVAGSPGLAVDQFGFEGAVECFGHGVVVGSRRPIPPRPSRPGRPVGWRTGNWCIGSRDLNGGSSCPAE